MAYKWTPAQRRAMSARMKKIRNERRWSTRKDAKLDILNRGIMELESKLALINAQVAVLNRAKDILTTQEVA